MGVLFPSVKAMYITRIGLLVGNPCGPSAILKGKSGVGEGVGGAGVGVSVGGLGLGVLVGGAGGAEVGVSRGATVAVPVGMAVSMNINISVNVDVSVGVLVGVGVNVTVGVGVQLGVAVNVGRAVLVGRVTLPGAFVLPACAIFSLRGSTKPHPKLIRPTIRIAINKFHLCLVFKNNCILLMSSIIILQSAITPLYPNSHRAMK